MNASSIKFYDRITFFYPMIDLFLMPQKRKLFREINSYPEGNLLEVGVGDGAHLKYYEKHTITGIDTSGKMLEKARKHQTRQIHLLQMNGEALSFEDQSFDYVVLSHVIAVVGNPDKLLMEVHRVLRPNGKVFILNHFTPRNWLRFLDIGFSRISRLFHFRSLFRISSLKPLQQFKLLKASDAYFKILIYEKSL